MNIINKRIEAFVIDIIVLIIMSSSFFLISVWLNNSMLWMSFALALIYSFLFCKKYWKAEDRIVYSFREE